MFAVLLMLYPSPTYRLSSSQNLFRRKSIVIDNCQYLKISYFDANNESLFLLLFSIYHRTFCTTYKKAVCSILYNYFFFLFEYYISFTIYIYRVQSIPSLETNSFLVLRSKHSESKVLLWNRFTPLT